MDFEKYLRVNQDAGIIDFRVRYTVSNQGIGFYIHPIDQDGMTADFRVEGNNLTYIPPIPPIEPQDSGGSAT